MSTPEGARAETALGAFAMVLHSFFTIPSYDKARLPLQGIGSLGGDQIIGITHLKQYGHRPPQRRAEALRRLTLIEGQVRGVHRMVVDDRYCVDVLTQIAAAREALRQVGMVVLRNYLEACVTNATKEGDPAIYDELMTMINRYELER